MAVGIQDYLRSKRLDRWLDGYARHLLRNAHRPAVTGPRQLLFTICDHYEPLWGGADHARGLQRVRAWREGYPQLAQGYRDHHGRPPRYSFFFPGEQYHPQYLEPLAQLARAGLGEVEFHLHHEDDTAENLRREIPRYLSLFAEHGHVSRDADGKYRYAFIHGNWCLANARADGRFCGVDNELPLLFETGCYADFTFPSAPDECQPNLVNQIYWPVGDLSRRRAYESGAEARVGQRMSDRLLMIQGPLSLSLRANRVPIRIEGSHLSDVDPPGAARLRSWVARNIHVVGRPEWVFVKVHTHGAPEGPTGSLLGAGGHALHQALTTHYNDGKRWALHYVTAREMYNIAIAAMEGHSGDPGDYRDHVIPPPPAAG